jgi:hypothetical protein
MGYAAHPELDTIDGERTVHCCIRDCGPAGSLGLPRHIVYRDIGLQPPAPGAVTQLAAETIREALRCFHQPNRLATSPLARGGTVQERAESVRRVVRQAVEDTFGDSPAERLLRDTIVRGYLDPDAGHERAQLDLHVSRTTYFRQLSDASQRVADHVLAALR